MRTDRLISILADDPPAARRIPPAVPVAAVAAGAGLLTAAILWALVDFRPGAALLAPAALVKLAFAAGLALGGLALSLRARQPQAIVRIWPYLTPAFGLLIAAAAAEMALTATASWSAAIRGEQPVECFVWFLLTSALPTVGVLWVLRGGAPASERTAGAAAGLLGGGVGLAVYSLHCPNDSALFVAVWYVAGVATVAALAAASGRRLLRW